MAREQELFDGILKGNKPLVEEIVKENLEAKTNAEELLMGTMVPAMTFSGRVVGIELMKYVESGRMRCLYAVSNS